MAQTPNFEITEIAANQNQKEVTANTAIVELEAALSDAITIAIPDADYTLTPGEGGEALGNFAFVFTGTITAQRNIIIPNNKKLYAIFNETSTSLGFNIVVKTAAGSGVTIASSTAYSLVYCDGVNAVAVGGSGGGGGGTGATINNQTGSYVAQLSDANNIVAQNSGSGSNFTVPPTSDVAFPVGTILEVIQNGAGQVTLDPGLGVTINTASSLTSRTQYSTVALTHMGGDTWIASGDLT